MTAVILAAGTATRLHPLTEDTPKALLPVGGIPLLQRMLETLGQSGIRDSVIVTGHLQAVMKRFLATSPPGIRVTEVFNPLYASTHNNYSLWLALRECPGEEVLLLDADILFTPRILTLLLETRHENALVLKVDPGLGEEEMKVACQPDGRVTAIGKHLDPAVSAGESLGIEKFSGQWTEMLLSVLGQRKERREFYEASFQELINRGLPLFAVSSFPYECIEIDTLADLAAADLIAQRMTV
jgi:choline kinase